MTTQDYLEKLIAFDTTSALSNIALIDWVEGILVPLGANVQIIRNADGSKANIFATIGPADRPGVMLSGHTDVVPVVGQNWSRPAFEMTRLGDNLYGRGTTDMKGFVAAMLTAAHQASKQPLDTPLHLALSYDEEIGCMGVRSLIDMLALAQQRPKMCIVGEPTGLTVATGHKGKCAARAHFNGLAGHSALAPFAINAVYMASDFITALRNIQEELQNGSMQDHGYDVPYTTLHVGRIEGGGALNIVPQNCWLDFEIRNISQDNPVEILERLQASCDEIVTEAQKIAPDAAIEINVSNTYPGLDTPETSQVVAFVKSLTGANSTRPTVVCGPGDMAQGHKADEFITRTQLDLCDEMLANLVSRLVVGL
jgi:acetylornithine deacetylase